jgi:metal-responsive CopG/Arc/MetJ family transcriptional regulator
MKPTPIRIPEDLLKRIDAIVLRLAKQPGASVDRSKVIRMALAEGVARLEKRK